MKIDEKETMAYKQKSSKYTTLQLDTQRRGKVSTMPYDRHRHGKDYIISMFMESLYLSKKYWERLQPVNLGEC